MASLLGRFIRIIFVVAAFVAVGLPNPAQAAPFAAIVIDARSGEVLYEKNADTRLHPASLTKMMTLYIVFQEIEAGRLHLDDKVTVTKYAASQPPSRLGLRAGQKIAVRYLIRAAAVKSANDAAAALGDHISGSPDAFGKRMTKTARALGMKNSTFKNANGLTAEGHLSTARDMTILGRHLFYDFPQYYNIFSRRTADAGMATVHNTNTRFLDAYEGADGIKTGYTVAAGFNLTASAQRGNKRIIATVFGGSSTAARNAKMSELMDLGFGAARKNVREQVPSPAPVPEEPLVAAAPEPIDDSGIPGGAAKTVSVSGEVVRSLRPKARPGATAVADAGLEPSPEPEPAVPDEMAVAIAAGIDSALDEALAEPPPSGTLEAQAYAIENGTADPTDVEAENILAEVVPAEPPPEGTLEAQALALADLAPPADAGSLADMAPASTDEAAANGFVAVTPDPDLAAARPMVRPASVETNDQPAVMADLEEPPTAPVEDLNEATQNTDVVASTEAGIEETVQVADVEVPIAPEVVEMESVAAAESASEQDTETAGAKTVAVKPARSAPIFDSPEPTAIIETAAAEEPEEQLVVVVKSTSGGRHFGVNVGNYTSRSQAERELLKVALVESATLSQGLRKISEKGGKYHANFMGLTEDQAALACRRLKARGVACETLG